MAQIVPVGVPVNDAERRAIDYLREHAPGDWVVLHNLEVANQGRWFEVGLVVIAPHAVYVLDVKGIEGLTEVVGPTWYPSGHQPFRSPVPKLAGHAATVKGLLTKASPALHELYVGELVVLTAPDAALAGTVDRDRDTTVRLDELIPAIADRSRITGRFDTSGRLTAEASIADLLAGVARPANGPRIFGSWEVAERLSEADDVSEYRARSSALPDVSAYVRLRVYALDAYLDADERDLQRHRMGNAFTMLSRLPAHPNVVPARDFFVGEGDDRAVLVLDDVQAEALRPRLTTADVLSADAKLRIIGDILKALEHAHRNRVIHRAISPDTVLLAADGRALLTGFDFARGVGPRAYTVADQIPDAVDPAYLAPEGRGDLSKLTAASDLYALGVLGYHLFTGEPAFTGSADQYHKGDTLSAAALAEAGTPGEIARWLRAIAAPDPRDRPDTARARASFERIVGGPARTRDDGSPGAAFLDAAGGTDEERYKEHLQNLEDGHQLTPNYRIRRKLGRGTFGVVYRVHDGLAGTDRALKLVLEDPNSVIERLKQEYRSLLNLPPHPNVVHVRHADFVPGTGIPYLVTDYVPGRDVAVLAADGTLGAAGVRELGIGAARGLEHIHAHGVQHCDIKPRNLLLTRDGPKIIDFNVSVGAEQTLGNAGISLKYAPPDYDRRVRPTPETLVDRDVYALGLTLYEALTGMWPWQGSATTPPPDAEAPDPRRVAGCDDLAPEFVDVLMRAIKPLRADRYADATEFRAALEAVPRVRKLAPVPAPVAIAGGDAEERDNPFVAYLQTLYSQSRFSNSGTRGLDSGAQRVYVPTLLDSRLIGDVLSGMYRLVIITGNAGDGKTALIENLVAAAADRPGTAVVRRANGADFTIDGHRFRTNNDGSQDESDRPNEDVLDDFFAPYAGSDMAAWPSDQTRLIAINEGRLTDFLDRNRERFAALGEIVDADAERHGVVIVNLNHRSVLAPVPDSDEESIFDRMLNGFTDNAHWAACGGCELADRCYALHNAKTFAHPTAGPQARFRLRRLYELTHLRGKLHITLRDLRSALAFMLTSGRSCTEIRELYAADAYDSAILDSFYFTSWAGAPGTRDRLLALLRESDIRDDADPELDRRLDFTGPQAGSALVPVDERGDHDERLLAARFAALRRDGGRDSVRLAEHRGYVQAARRRYFFESQDPEHWLRLLPYSSAEDLGDLLAGPPDRRDAVARLLRAINRSEGLAGSERLGDRLALAVREVKNGSIRGYRLFDHSAFELGPAGPPSSKYLETRPDHLVLRHRSGGERDPELVIRLDLFELLDRLGRGGLRAPADVQGHHLSLEIFKNMLMTSPYQEVMLTVTGHDLHRVSREPDGTLVLHPDEQLTAKGDT